MATTFQRVNPPTQLRRAYKGRKPQPISMLGAGQPMVFTGMGTGGDR